MTFTVEVPDNAKNIKVSFVCDDKPYKCKETRYSPGFWNGINGGMKYGQYFDMEDENRIKEMTEVASVLNEHGIRYQLTKLKRQYRITISNSDYLHMNEIARETILDINKHHNRIRELLEEHEAKTIECKMCGRRMQTDWNWCPWCRWETALEGR